jgi:hypothetical protein
MNLYDGTGIKIYDDGSTNDPFYWDMPQAVCCNTSDVIAVKSWQNFQLREMSAESYRMAKSLFYRSLQPVATVQETVHDMHKRYFEGNEVIGVHIRMTDHLTWTKKDPRLLSPINLFIEKMERILDASPETRFFLSTDDKKSEKRIRELFRGSVIVHEKESYHKQDVCRDTKRGIQEALIDWLLLSKTSRIIGSYSSSFSREAGAVHMIHTEFILRREELSRTHYKRTLECYGKKAKGRSRKLFRKYIKKPVKTYLRRPIKVFVKAPYQVLRKEGLKRFFLYACSSGKEKLSGWIRKNLSRAG